MNLSLILIASIISMLSSIFAAIMALLAARHSRFNSVLLKTNAGKTIGQHIEEFQEDQLVLRGELSNIAREKLKADAELAAASLEAIAKLSAASDINMIETAKMSAAALRSTADRTAHLMTIEEEDPTITAKALIVKANETASLLSKV